MIKQCSDILNLNENNDSQKTFLHLSRIEYGNYPKILHKLHAKYRLAYEFKRND